MFAQLLTPIGGSLGLSFAVATLPIVVVLVMLGVLRRPAWQAALAGLITGLVIAIAGWNMPAGLALDAVAAGAVFALWPVMWIVVNALLLYNIAVKSGRFDAFRDWVIEHLPNDRRVVLVVIGFCFGALLEGIAGFGTPVAITSSLLILVGFPAARGAGLRADLQHRAGGLRRARRAGDGARRGHRAASHRARRDGRPPAARHGASSCRSMSWRSTAAAFGPRAVAGSAGRGRQLRGFAVRHLQLPGLCADRCAGLARLADRDAAVPAGLASRARSGIPDLGCGSRRGESIVRRALARLAALAHRVGAGDRVDAFRLGVDRPARRQVAGLAQRDLDHALQREALCRRLGLPAARHRHRHPGGGDHHGVRRPALAGGVLRLRRTRPSGRSGSRSSPSC